MPCTTNSAHAQHTFVRGCCQSTCPCPGGSSYSAEPYCPCNDTVARNRVISYRDVLCTLLATLETNSPYTTAAFTAAIGATDFFSTVKCGSFTILAVPTAGTTITVGTVVNGVFTADTPLNADDAYSLVIQGVLTVECANITIANP
jgi:hypothetical protein